MGWPKARVTARVKLLELPERAQEMVGAGTIALSAVDQLRSIGQVSRDLLDAVIEYLAAGNEWAAERLPRQPGWVLDAALEGRSSKVFAEELSQVDPYELAELKLAQRPIIVDRKLYRELAKVAIARTTDGLREQVAAAAAAKKQARNQGNDKAGSRSTARSRPTPRSNPAATSSHTR